MEKQERILIDIEESVYLRWSKERGARLRSHLGQYSSYMISDRLKSRGVECSAPNVVKIMSGRSQNINTELLLEICKEFGLDIKDIIPTRTEQESKENSP